MNIYYADARELDDEKIAACMGNLSEYRKNKISKLRYDKDKRLSLAAGILLSYSLKNYGISEKNCKYKVSEFGKPYLADYPDINFSLSHSGDLAALIIGNNEICGIDVEQIKHFPSKEKVSKRFFNQKDFELLSSLDGEEADRYFAKVWTRTESYAKMTGKGLDFSDEKQSRVTDDAFMKSYGIYFIGYEIVTDKPYFISACSIHHMHNLACERVDL